MLAENWIKSPFMDQLPKILIVDDQDPNLQALSRLLRKFQAQIVSAHSGREALALYRESEFALAILDIQMPEMDGFEVAERMSDIKPSRPTPILFLTAAYTSETNRERAYAAGAVDFMTKPFEMSELLSKVQVFLNLDLNRISKARNLAQLSELNLRLSSEVLERQATEQALKNSRQALQAIFDGMLDAILILDPSGQVTDTNYKAELMLRQSRDQLIGSRLEDYLFGPRCPKQGLANQLFLHDQAGSQLFSWQATAKTGGFFEVEVALSRIPKGGTVSILVAIRDVSIKKQRQDQLRKLSLAVEQSPTSIVITDTKAHIEYVNPKFCELTGYTKEELLGKNPRILKSGKTPKKIYRSMWSSLKKGEEWRGELLNKKKNGELFYELTHISPILDGRGIITHYLGTKEDITSRKKVEQTLIKATIEAKQANRSKSAFLANMSHEIRTPMNAILGFTDLLRSTAQNEEDKLFLNSIFSAGQALLTLINDILDLSKVESGKLILEYHAIDPRPLLGEIAQLFAHKVEEKGLEFRLALDPKLPLALVLDEIRLRQILLNLVGNAVKFTESGYIRLSAKTRPQADGLVDLVLKIEDSGIGIAKEHQENIFGAFEQAGSASLQKGGTGLGLAITKRLVEMMGGQILLKSKLGKGSSFTVLLKNIKTAPFPEARVNELEEPFIERKFAPAVLVLADDLEINRSLIKSYCAACPFTFYEAKNGLEALALVEQVRPDLVLMDMKMPQMDGYEATAQLKKDPNLKNIPVIAVTASVMKEDEARILSVCDALVPKPVVKAVLFAKLAPYLKEASDSDLIQPKEEGIEPPEPAVADPKALSALLKRLEQHYNPRRLSIAKTLTLNDAEKFAEDLLKETLETPYPPLSDWAKLIYTEARDFEANRLKESLTGFTGLLSDLETFLQPN
ncbi:MAG: hypothetical protein A2527_08170 [Candidatus Lambdaproteobacteria bacterium RIFOXYD2_FULL_50_16]|uniref:histidine kinase n=1 Tax=Candidatus Lambdaproteobacteria bacterium RIFOXYD2_FULL_50_16 TaxID=1817772 RepID=A0A1F6GAJ8_9PROT|nr:MAG: hypothetical protein A2527_08170 [Candidatus Lambdaproteobacteria bacterium RIFOXYD2_FULL_50_16]